MALSVPGFEADLNNVLLSLRNDTCVLRVSNSTILHISEFPIPDTDAFTRIALSTGLVWTTPIVTVRANFGGIDGLRLDTHFMCRVIYLRDVLVSLNACYILDSHILLLCHGQIITSDYRITIRLLTNLASLTRLHYLRDSSCRHSIPVASLCSRVLDRTKV